MLQALNEKGVRLYLLRFGLYGLLFFSVSAYLSLGGQSPEEGAIKFAAAFGVVGGASSMLSAFAFRLLVQFYRELLGLDND